MSFYCARCGWDGAESDLDERDASERRPYGNGYVTEYLTVLRCPSCGSEDVEELTADDLAADEFDLEERRDWPFDIHEEAEA